MNTQEIKLRLVEAFIISKDQCTYEELSEKVDRLVEYININEKPKHILDNYYRLVAITELTEKEAIELNVTAEYLKPYFKSKEPISPTELKIKNFFENHFKDNKDCKSESATEKLMDREKQKEELVKIYNETMDSAIKIVENNNKVYNKNTHK